ncbi:MAG: response regulator [Deltaproteobacteria bacterium]|jgi:CheY-like chemotaxis protein
MSDRRDLDQMRILIVDDEPDILAVLEGLLSESPLVKASSFQEAKGYLESQTFDIAILDIMGVDGYRLLDIAKEKGVTAVMLTAHALSPEDTAKSYKKGAAFYVPKDEISNIRTFLEDVLEAQERGKSTWSRWLHRFGAFYEKRFGSDWQKKDKEFWDKFVERYGMW